MEEMIPVHAGAARNSRNAAWGKGYTIKFYPGYADIAYIPSPKYPDKPAMLIELKYNKSADTALSQILKQNYPERLEHYKKICFFRKISNR
ncbi:hypothetical protein [Butyrivibrio sp. WCD2001]|uniref:hypothetical protein n=1 Tax=Butyrivibrio sp. WCD2001 TaxID=1280681 RepID=UPI0012DF4178|nr:hypothetical protein [Butyrivibrio sp. WCD2001]